MHTNNGAVAAVGWFETHGWGLSRGVVFFFKAVPHPESQFKGNKQGSQDRITEE